MTSIDRRLARNRIIARRFGCKAEVYDGHAGLQRRAAARLASHVPPIDNPSILEVGCGTGFLTRHLLEAYPGGHFLVTDLAPEMLARCRETLGPGKGGTVRFVLMDGEAPDSGQCFDLIALSMTLQWFADPLAGLERLRGLLNPGGKVLYATIGPESFPEWRAALEAEQLPSGTAGMPPLPGVVEEERVTVDYVSAGDFLGSLKAIGAGEPRAGYRPLPPGTLRRAMRRLDKGRDCRITWQFVYGMIPA